MALYNAVRFGSPLETGYEEAVRTGLGVGLFETPFYLGAAGLLVSPGKGVLLFNPLLVLAMPGAWALRRTRPRLATMIVGTLIVSVLLHGRCTTWAGDFTWGPRYLASQVGLWMLGLSPLLARPRGRRWCWVVLAASACIQFASVFYSYALEFCQDGRKGLLPDGYVWHPRESQLFIRFQNMGLHAAGRPNYDSIPPATPRPAVLQMQTPREAVRLAHAVHFFPFKAYAYTGNRKLFAALLAIWLGLLILLMLTAWAWRRRLARRT